MSNFEQNYNFNQPQNGNHLPDNDENKTVKVWYAVWTVCVVVTFAILILGASISILTFNPFMVIVGYMDLLDYAPVMVPIIILMNIVQHIIAIVCKIKYPLNEKANKMFKADMIILAVTVIAGVVWIASVGILCHQLSECG